METHTNAFICPVEKQIYSMDDPDEFCKAFAWHEKNCCCFLMKWYSFHFLEQDDHVRFYEENERHFLTEWHPRFGRVYGAVDTLEGMIESKTGYTRYYLDK